MSMASLEARLHDEAESRYNKNQRKSLEDRLARNIAELKAMEVPSPVPSPARTESTVNTETSSDNDVMYVPEPFSVKKDPLKPVVNEDQIPWELVEQRGRSLSKPRNPRAPAEQSLPPASGTFDENFDKNFDRKFPAVEELPRMFILHSPSYESEFPSLPVKYLEQVSVIHSISTFVHPPGPEGIKERETPVFRLNPSLCDMEMDTSVEEESPTSRKRFQESWKDADLVDTSDIAASN